jgi:hypothetical protein
MQHPLQVDVVDKMSTPGQESLILKAFCVLTYITLASSHCAPLAGELPVAMAT